MGGKGRRRREKNYLAAHGGDKRLPPPPNVKDLEALPSKLRKIIELKNSSAAKYGDAKNSAEIGQGKRKDESFDRKSQKPNLKELRSTAVNATQPRNDFNEKAKGNLVTDRGSAEASSPNASKRKRKRYSAKDLRFEALDQLAKGSKRKERKKEYLKERKNKRKRVKEDNALDFPGRENIRFGEVVVAPLKLSLPKVSKASTMDASKERLRLQAVELYRKSRGWESRPGIKL
ncbi:uncharacterized protein LOC110020941 [Phalaenopsis equestris]|uniref:uncharacterized protein LOC110020941 n=1 Tax=Phalaenopsis equestris TaxID=78828 RepID=UPI0009E3EF8B|nr:uncharacterized protein LOC110020941 [Phalaenopsis equestris]XP_020574906.1 uncharacterized protein LOC110020941 [Phalaenopsis equestris]